MPPSLVVIAAADRCRCPRKLTLIAVPAAANRLLGPTNLLLTVL